jgi:hypothetical protein
MKKIVLSLAGVMAAVAFAPEASALPVFARQTGMACSACHFQHFPLLNGFGRAFKAAGFTMMGAQGKVEEAGSLSIPAELNMAVLTSFGYGKTNQTADTTAVTKNAGNGTFGIIGSGNGGGMNEASLFFGGHVSDNAGFLAELGLGGAGAALGSAKLPILYEVADGVRAGVVPFSTDAQGASYGMELLNTGANAVHMMSNTVGFNNEFANAMSAQQYLNTAGAADGAGLVVTNDKYFVNLTKFNQAGIASAAIGSLTSTYARAAAMFDLAGWDTGVGIQGWSGESLSGGIPGAYGGAITPMVGGTALILYQTKATAIDGQMQGSLGGMPVGFYASYATAPSGNGAVLQNAYNVGTLTRSSINLDAEVGVVPEIVTVGAAIRRGNSGFASATGGNASDNAIMLTGTYKIQQNMLARLSYVHQTGDYWNLQNAAGRGTNALVLGSNKTMLKMFFLF